LKGFRDSVTAIGNSVAEFVQLASPVHVQRFVIASEDLTASIGKILIPMMEFATKTTRAFADVIFTLSGPLKRLTEAGFDQLATVFDAAMDTLTPFIPLLTSWINLMALAMESQAAWMKMIGQLNHLFSFGGAAGGGKILKDSTGAAVRPAQFTSVEAYGKAAQQAAFSLGSAADPAEQTSLTVKDIYNLLVSWAGKLENLPQSIADAIKNKTAEVVRDVADVPRELGAAGRDAGRWLEERGSDIERRARDIFGDLF
jgi:hypothetical protein